MESLVAVACISYYIFYQDGISLLVVISIVGLYCSWQQTKISTENQNIAIDNWCYLWAILESENCVTDFSCFVDIGW